MFSFRIDAELFIALQKENQLSLTGLIDFSSMLKDFIFYGKYFRRVALRQRSFENSCRNNDFTMNYFFKNTHTRARTR